MTKASVVERHLTKDHDMSQAKIHNKNDDISIFSKQKSTAQPRIPPTPTWPGIGSFCTC